MTTLRQGDRGPAVRELQFLLLVTGHDPGPLDGVFGPRTRSAADAHIEIAHPHGPTNGSTMTCYDIAHLRALPRRAVEVPRILTPVSAADMRIALVAGYAAIVEPVVLPSAHTRMSAAVRVALAQLCVEHGCNVWAGDVCEELDRKRILPGPWLWPPAPVATYIYVWCNNIGNRQVTREDRSESYFPMGPPRVPYFLLPADEGDGAKVRRLTSACYAFPNIAEGAANYWRFLRDHCGPALAAFERGDPAAAAHELKVGQWHYSGSEAAYARAMVDRFAKIQ